jgi:hypothetical protein
MLSLSLSLLSPPLSSIADRKKRYGNPASPLEDEFHVAITMAILLPL